MAINQSVAAPLTNGQALANDKRPALKRAEGAPRQRPGVLIVDDDRAIRIILGTGLESEGLTTWLADSGLDALTIYRENRRDVALVLMDVNMPGLDGPRTLIALRKMDPAVRCCFMTGGLVSYTEEYLRRLGAEQVFHKPFVLTDLIRVLGDMVSRAPRSEC
jgi:CheY-like chemotaxis protein